MKDTSLLRSQIDYTQIIDEESYENKKQRIRACAQAFSEDPFTNMTDS